MFLEERPGEQEEDMVTSSSRELVREEGGPGVVLQCREQGREEDMVTSLRRELAKAREGAPDIVIHCRGGGEVFTHRSGCQ